jgi:hypothetical protein
MDVKNEMKWQEWWTNFKTELNAELDALGMQLTGLVQKNLEPANVTGNLAGSFFYNLKPIEFGTQFEFGTPVDSVAAYVEFGTRAHWAPIQPIAEWVEMKLQPHVLSMGVSFKTGKAMPSGRSKKLTGDARKNAVMQLAYMIRAKIAREGTKEQKYMERALNELGIAFVVEAIDTGMEYVLDLTEWLGEKASEISERAAKGLTS